MYYFQLDSYSLINYPCCQTSEDAHKYVMALKMCLRKELEPEHVNLNCSALGHPYNKELHTSMQTFWDVFYSGVTTQTVTCLECNNVTTRDKQFSELKLKFPQQPSAGESLIYMLASLCQHYTSGWEDKINDYVCFSCNRRTSATQQEHIAQYPEILAVKIWRNTDDENRNIDKAVEFPLNCVCPYTLHEQQEGTAENTLYKLFGIVQHEGKTGSGGHYTAVTNKGTTDRWHHYNDSNVNVIKFQYRRQNKTYIGFQRSASILFYRCSRPPRCIHNDSIMVDITRCLNNNNGEPTNPSTECTIENTPQVLNAYANTMILDSLRPTATERPVPTIVPEDSRQRVIDHSGKRIA
jgi:hypothetical protein